MIKKKSIYRCAKCGNVVESLWNGQPSLVCCNEEMKELLANTVDAAKEKHVPVIERNGTTVTVKVGSVPHPMTKEHYILCVELLYGDTVLRYDFKEGDTVAEATFLVPEDVVDLQAREYCNLHGLWANK
ncbi:MAG: desulfoferrodoxin [Chitinispirillaceae bacterium]|nr:desulfoferrodoxin [Chitinispirillaceae bacterium]